VVYVRSWSGKLDQTIDVRDAAAQQGVDHNGSLRARRLTPYRWPDGGSHDGQLTPPNTITSGTTLRIHHEQ